MKAPSNDETVDAYLAAQDGVVQARLSRIRSAIQKAVPQAQEQISYRMPAYKLAGQPLLYFAAFKAHIGLYPMVGGIKAAFAKELAPFPQSKGTVRFPHDRPVPYGLIEKIAKLRAAEIAAQLAAKAKPKTRSKGALKTPARYVRAGKGTRA